MLSQPLDLVGTPLVSFMLSLMAVAMARLVLAALPRIPALSGRRVAQLFFGIIRPFTFAEPSAAAGVAAVAVTQTREVAAVVALRRLVEMAPLRAAAAGRLAEQTAGLQPLV